MNDRSCRGLQPSTRTSLARSVLPAAIGSRFIARTWISPGSASEPYKDLLRNFLRAKYAHTKIDLIVPVMGPALDFVLSGEGAFLPEAPIVFCGVDSRYLVGRSLPRHVRGVILKREFAPTLEIALRLHPSTQRVVIVGGTSPFDTQLLEFGKTGVPRFRGRVSFTYLTALSFQRLLTEVAQLPPRIVMYTSLFQDGVGEAFVPHNAVARISAAASVPVYGFVDQYVGRGIVGGSLCSLAAHGTQAGMLAADVLSGKESEPAVIEGCEQKAGFQLAPDEAMEYRRGRRSVRQ